MRLCYEWLILIILVVLSVCLTDSASNEQNLAPMNSSQLQNASQTLKPEQNARNEPKGQKKQKEPTTKQQRPRRQKPNKRKKPPPGVFASLGSLVKDTFKDVRVAYRNISRIYQDSLKPPTTPADSMSSASGDNNGTTTTPAPPPRPPPGQQQIFDILGKNYRGLRKLWDSELKLAMTESRKNIRRFQKELRESIRPFLLPSQNDT